jgi:hypothetical protein
MAVLFMQMFPVESWMQNVEAAKAVPGISSNARRSIRFFIILPSSMAPPPHACPRTIGNIYNFSSSLPSL